MESNTINERIQQIVDELFNGNKAAFAKAIGKAPTTVANILGARKTTPSSDFVESIKNSIENIKLLIKYDEYDELPKVLKQTANLRLNNPEASLTELAELLNCSRSAINHRMRKIDALAMQIRKDNSIEE